MNNATYLQSSTMDTNYLDDLIHLTDRQVCRYYTLSSMILKSLMAKSSQCSLLVRSIYGISPKLGQYAHELQTAYEDNSELAELIITIHHAKRSEEIMKVVRDERLEPSRSMLVIFFYATIAIRYCETPGLERKLGIVEE